MYIDYISYIYNTNIDTNIYIYNIILINRYPVPSIE